MRSSWLVLALTVLAVLGIAGLWIAGVVRESNAVAPAPVAAADDATRPEALEDPRAPRSSEVPSSRSEVSGAGLGDLDLLDDADAGRLDLSFVDAATGEPIPNLRFAAFSERPRAELVALGTSDDRGRARLDDVSHELVLVETLRTPPHAVTIAAAWLKDRPRQELVVRVGRGGTVVGRVVDDLGEPYPGCVVQFHDWSRVLSYWGDQGLERAEERKTDATGAFRFEAVKSTAGGVWLVDGEPRPKKWWPVFIETSAEERRLQVDEGQLVRVGDLVVPRERIYHGIVRNARGLPLEGALVSAKYERWIEIRFGRASAAADSAPGGLEFEPADQEILTAEDGSFQLSADLIDWLYVLAPNRCIERFPVVPPEPGERTEPLELVLSDSLVMEFELLDADGGRIVEPPKEIANRRVRNLLAFGRNPRVARFDLELTDGSWEEVSTAAQRDGLYRVAFESPPDSISGLRIALPGYAPLDTPASNWLTPGHRASFQLEPLPEIRVRVVPPELGEGEQLDLLTLHACTLDIATLQRRFEERDHVCCGLGCYRSVAPADMEEGKVLALPVLERKSYEVAVAGRREGSGAFAVLLTATPGDRVHDLVLDRSFVLPPQESAVEEAPDEERTPPPPTRPGVDQPLGRVALLALDVTTGERVPSVLLSGDPQDREGRAPSRSVELMQVPRGDRTSCQFPVGHWALYVNATGYREIGPLDVEVTLGTETDLGVFELEPEPRLVVVLRSSDDSPVPEDVRLEGQCPKPEGGFRSFELRSDSARRYERSGDLPDALLIDVQSVDRDMPGCQRFAVPGWTDGVPVELTLAPSTDVLVEVRVPPDLRYSPLAVEAQAQDALPPDAGPTFEAVDWPALRPIPAVEGQPHSDGLRTFRLRLGPGPYELRAEGPLFEIEPATIEIGAEGGERRVELTARS